MPTSALLKKNPVTNQTDLAYSLFNVSVSPLVPIDEPDFAFDPVPANTKQQQKKRSFFEWLVSNCLRVTKNVAQSFKADDGAKGFKENEKWKKSREDTNAAIAKLYDHTEYLGIQWDEASESNPLWVEWLDPNGKKLKERGLTTDLLKKEGENFNIVPLSPLWSPAFINQFGKNLEAARTALKATQTQLDKTWHASSLIGWITYPFRGFFRQYREIKMRLKMRETMLDRVERELTIAKFETLNQAMGLVPEDTLIQYRDEIKGYLNKNGFNLDVSDTEVQAKRRAMGKKHGVNPKVQVEHVAQSDLKNVEKQAEELLKEKGWDAEKEMRALFEEENEKRWTEFAKKARRRLHSDQTEAHFQPFFMDEAKRSHAEWCQFDDAVNFFKANTPPDSLNQKAVQAVEYLRAKPEMLDRNISLFADLNTIMPGERIGGVTIWKINSGQTFIPKDYEEKNKHIVATEGAPAVFVRRILVPTIEQLMNHEIAMQNIPASAYADWLRGIDNACESKGMMLNNLVKRTWDKEVTSKKALLALIDLPNSNSEIIPEKTKDRRLFARGTLLNMVFDRDNDDAILQALHGHIHAIQTVKLSRTDKKLFELMIDILPKADAVLGGFVSVGLSLTGYLQALINKSISVLEDSTSEPREVEHALAVLHWIKKHHFSRATKFDADPDALIRINANAEACLEKCMKQHLDENRPWTGGMHSAFSEFGAPNQVFSYYQNALKQINTFLEKKEIENAKALMLEVENKKAAGSSSDKKYSVLDSGIALDEHEAVTFYRFALLTNDAKYIAKARMAAVKQVIQKKPNATLAVLDACFVRDKTLHTFNQLKFDEYIKAIALTDEKRPFYHQIYLMARFASTETMQALMKQLFESFLKEEGSDQQLNKSLTKVCSCLSSACSHLNGKTDALGKRLLLPKDEATCQSMKKMILSVMQEALLNLTQNAITDEQRQGLATLRAKLLHKAQVFISNTAELKTVGEGLNIVQALELRAWLKGEISNLSAETKQKHDEIMYPKKEEILDLSSKTKEECDEIMRAENARQAKAWDNWLGSDQTLQELVLDACHVYIKNNDPLWNGPHAKERLIEKLDRKLASEPCAFVRMLARQAGKFKPLHKAWRPLEVRLLSREIVKKAQAAAENEIGKLFSKTSGSHLFDVIKGQINALKTLEDSFEHMRSNDGTLLPIDDVSAFIGEQKKQEDFALWQAKLRALSTEIEAKMYLTSGSERKSRLIGLHSELLGIKNKWNHRNVEAIYYKQLEGFLGNLAQGNPQFWHFASPQDWVPVLQRLVDYTARDNGVQVALIQSLEQMIHTRPYLRAPLTCLKDLVRHGVQNDALTEKRVMVLHAFGKALRKLDTFDAYSHKDEDHNTQLRDDKAQLLQALLGINEKAGPALQKGLKSVVQFDTDNPAGLFKSKDKRLARREAKCRVEALSHLFLLFAKEHIQDKHIADLRAKEATLADNSRKVTKMFPMFGEEMWHVEQEDAVVLKDKLANDQAISVVESESSASKTVPAITYISRRFSSDVSASETSSLGTTVSSASSTSNRSLPGTPTKKASNFSNH